MDVLKKNLILVNIGLKGSDIARSHTVGTGYKSVFYYHKTHIVRKTTPSFIICLSLTYIGPILKKIQPLLIFP